MSPLELLLKKPADRDDEDSQSSSAPLSGRALVAASSELRKSRIEEDVVRLYEKTAAPLLRYGLAICGDLETAQDAVQEAFLRYYVALRKSEHPRDPKRWIYSTTRNYILDRLKEYYFRNGRSLEAASRVEQEGVDPEVQIILREIDATAQEFLSPRELECLRLRNEGMRYRDIAEILKIDSATVGVFLGRAIKKLRTALNPQDDEK